MQEVYASLPYYQAERALVITTADRISEPCRQLAAATGVRIIAREELAQLILAFKRDRFEEAAEMLELSEEVTEAACAESLEKTEQKRGFIKAGDYFYREG